MVVEKVMCKSYKYSKSCPEKLSFNSYAEKYHPLVVYKSYTNYFSKSRKIVETKNISEKKNLLLSEIER